MSAFQSDRVNVEYPDGYREFVGSPLNSNSRIDQDKIYAYGAWTIEQCARFERAVSVAKLELKQVVDTFADALSGGQKITQAEVERRVVNLKEYEEKHRELADCEALLVLFKGYMKLLEMKNSDIITLLNYRSRELGLTRQ